MTNKPEDLLKAVKDSIEALDSKIQHTPRSARVDINIMPHALPLSTIDPDYLLNHVAKLFSSRLDRSIAPLPPGVDPSRIPDADIMLFAIDNESLVRFEGGILRVPDLGRITPIGQMAFGQQTVAAVVTEGTSEEAFYLVKQLVILMWKSTGNDRSWTELEKYVERVRYQTETLVYLDAPLAHLFSDSVLDFLEEDVTGESGLGKSMGIRDINPEVHAEKVNNEIMASFHCRRVEFTISTYNKITADSEDNLLSLMINARSDANRDAILIASELSSEQHSQLVEKLYYRLHKNK